MILPGWEEGVLHGFSDASQSGYACVIYLCVVYADTTVNVVLVNSRTKVAPLKSYHTQVGVVWCALLAKTLNYVAEQLKLPVADFAWTDSTIILCWIKISPIKLKVFESNRVSQILDHLPAGQWRYVSTKNNPADLASRGVYPNNMLQAGL